MTDEEFKKAMTKIFIIVGIALVLMIVLSIVVFNQSGKSTTVFENEKQKENYENILENSDSENITQNEINELTNSVNEVIAE